MMMVLFYTSHLGLEFLSLHGIVADLKDDLRVVVDTEESKVSQGVLASEIVLLTQRGKDSHPVRKLRQKKRDI